MNSERYMKILIVEDNQVSARLAELSLRSRGYETFVAETARQALRLIEDSGPFDLVVCDVGLPGESGLDLLKQLRDRADTRALPVLMCTATADSASMEAAVAAGCSGYIVKPVSPARLVERVASVLAQGAAPAERIDGAGAE